MKIWENLYSQDVFNRNQHLHPLVRITNGSIHWHELSSTKLKLAVKYSIVLNLLLTFSRKNTARHEIVYRYNRRYMFLLQVGFRDNRTSKCFCKSVWIYKTKMRILYLWICASVGYFWTFLVWLMNFMGNQRRPHVQHS